ncbi:ABC transporter permease [Kaistia terrae]|uniref:ABC transporter permease n=1 Tax=Kaistia terrae TaxID=537017 RepID=A0ABW0PPQ6_9HYPH|nr:ABC transporter permease [Kaistia terrae]MCX5577709.1 ABC transporter permease [Kaistia terrae]
MASLLLSAAPMRRHVGLVAGALFLAALLLASWFLPLPYDPIRPDATATLQPPSAQHWFGTDSVGFDVFSRTIAAAGRDLPIAFGGALAAALIGVFLGLLATTKGRGSALLMRSLDAFQAFPLLVLAIAIVTLTGNRLEMVMFAIIIIEAPRFLRLVRAEGLAIREARFIEAAEVIGAKPLRVLLVHLLPNVSGVIAVQLSIATASSLMVVAALSFLGIGVSPPDPSWGAMIQAGARQMTGGQWWVALFPGLAIFLVVVCLNLVADALDVILERSSR